MEQIIGNILNIIASATQILTVLFKSKIKVLFGVLAASVIYVTAYLLMGLPTVAAMSAVGIIAPIINYLFEKADREKPWWVYVCLYAYIAATALVSHLLVPYTSIADLLPMCALATLVTSTIPKKQLVFRSLLFVMCVLWLSYGIFYNQFGVIIGNLIQMLFLAVQIVLCVLKDSKKASAQNGSN